MSKISVPVPVHVGLLAERLRHGHERAGDRSSCGGVFAEQTELGNRLLALDVAGERLLALLDQAFGDELGAAAFIQPVPRLPVDQVRTAPSSWPSRCSAR